VHAIKKQTGHEVTLRDVPLESLQVGWRLFARDYHVTRATASTCYLHCCDRQAYHCVHSPPPSCSINHQTHHLLSSPWALLQVFVGQRHHLGIQVEGITYEVTLNLESPQPQQQRSRPEDTRSPTSHPLHTTQQPHHQQSRDQQLSEQQQQQQALSDHAAPSPLVEYGPQHFASRKVQLPEVTLSDPLELLLDAAHELSLYLPHSADVGAARRIILAPGATVKVA
jgi:hypothetical protein